MKMKTPTSTIHTLKSLVVSIAFFFICQITFGQAKNSNAQTTNPETLSVPVHTQPAATIKLTETVVSTPDNTKYFDGRPETNERGQRVYILEGTGVKQNEILVPEVMDENKSSVITAEPK